MQSRNPEPETRHPPEPRPLMTIFHRLNPWQPGRREWALLALVVAIATAQLTCTPAIAAPDTVDPVARSGAGDPAIEAYNERIYDLPRSVLGFEPDAEIAAERWAERVRLLSMVTESGLTVGAIDDGTDPETRPEGRAVSRLLTWDPESLDPDAQQRRQKAAAAFRRLTDAGFFDRAAAVAEAGPIVWPQPDGLFFEHPAAELGTTRAAVTILFSSAELEAADGNPVEAIERLTTGFRLIDAAAAHPSIIGGMVASMLVADGVSSFARVLAHGGPWDEGRLFELQRELGRWVNLPSLELMFEAERLAELQVAEYLYVGGETGDRLDCERVVCVTGSAEGPDWRCDLLASLGVTRESELRDIDEAWDPIVSHTRLPPPLRALRLVREWNEQVGNPLADICFVLRVLLPNWQRAVPLVDKSHLHAAAAQWAIAIELHRARHGAMPDTLDEIDEDLRAGLTGDPFNNWKAFGYMTDPEANGEYTLYSVGIDGEDNGGTPWQGGEQDEALFHPKTEGTDLVLIERGSRPPMGP